VTFDEALREIGVAPGSSQEEIRRAYLRQVKVRKPEADPEGFCRLREAFDLLREQPELSFSPEILFRPGPADPEADLPGFEPDAFASELERIEAASTPEELLEAADAALRVLHMAEERRVLPHPLPILVLLLRLRAQGAATEADQVEERFQSLLRASGRELAVLEGRTAALWQVAQDLGRLSPEFPATARAAIGEAVASGAPRDALPELDRLIEEDGDLGWRMGAEIKELPGLQSLYHGAILEALAKRSPPDPGEISSPWHSRGLVSWVLGGFWLLFFLFRNCSQEPSMPPLQFLEPPKPMSRAAVDETLKAFCEEPNRTEPCATAREAIDHLRHQRCQEAALAESRLQRAVDLPVSADESGTAWGLLQIILAEKSRAGECPPIPLGTDLDASTPSMPPIPSIAQQVDLDDVRFGSLEDALARSCPSGTALAPGQSVLCSAARDAVASFRQDRCEGVRMTRDPLLEGLQMMEGTAEAHAAKSLVALIRSKYVHACRDRISWP
jgi:hypothetical protein